MTDDELIAASRTADDALFEAINYFSLRFPQFGAVLERALELDAEKERRGIDG